MKKNMGVLDRVMRIIIAAVIAVLFYTEILPHNWIGIVLMILAAIFLITAIIGTCPLYMLFRWSSSKK